MGSCGLAIILRVRPRAPDVWRIRRFVNCGATAPAWPANSATIASLARLRILLPIVGLHLNIQTSTDPEKYRV